MKFYRFVIVVCMCLSGAAQAALISYDHYTRDTQSGLDWLHLPNTAGMSYNQVLAETATGVLSGWRYATIAELSVWFDHAGGSGDYTYSGNAKNNGVVRSLLQYWGAPDGRSSAFFLTAEPGFLKHTHWFGFIYDETIYTDVMVLKRDMFEDDRGDYRLASALVRLSPIPVPEPAGLWLFIFGLCGLIHLKSRFNTNL